MQSIYRVEKNKDRPYVMLNKQFLNDERLTWKAKGILAYLLSLPDDWKIYEEEVGEHSRDGIDSLRTAIKELISSGYISRETLRNEKGQMQGYSYCVYEVPTETGKPKNGKSNTTNKDITNNNIVSKGKHHRRKIDGSLTEYQAKVVIEAANIERYLTGKRCEYEL